MAQECPFAEETADMQFKLHDRYNIFNASTDIRSNVTLLAVGKGLLFAGNPNAPELKVAIISELVDAKNNGAGLRMRTVKLSGVPNFIAASADGELLAVNYTLNGLAFLQIYRISSMLQRDIQIAYTLRLSAEENVFARQLLWNPVMTSYLAVVVNNGELVMFTLPGGDKYNMHTLDKSNKIMCGCWSPKGKQIVLGMPNGKLQQYKPDLTLAKVIACPPNIQNEPFDTIAVQWLSTFQFAVAFLDKDDQASPCVYIVNAPKGGTPTFIKYHDVCYSSIGPRPQRMQFTHFAPWNLLMAVSDNGIEVGVMGTKDTGDTPTWVQYSFADEARIEMPITKDKQDTFPIGFALDTSFKHNMIVGEQQFSITALVYMLSTHGHLMIFNFLNLTPNLPDIHAPVSVQPDASGQFQVIEGFSDIAQQNENTAGPTIQQSVNNMMAPPASSAGDMSFSFNSSTITSTPAKEKTTPLFGNFTSSAPFLGTQSSSFFGTASIAPQTTSQSLLTNPTSGIFNMTSTPAPITLEGFNMPSFGGAKPMQPIKGLGGSTNFFGNSTGIGAFPPTSVAKSGETTSNPLLTTPMPSLQPAQSSQSNQPAVDLNKPLYTVPSTFTPPATTKSEAAAAPIVQTQAPPLPRLDSTETEEIIRQLIAVEIESFNTELKHLAQQSKGLLKNMGRPEEMKSCTKRLNDLQEVIEQANDREFEMDVQNLRHSLNETYAMLAECRTKLEMFKDPDITRLTTVSTYDPINRRQLAQLQSYLAQNQVQMQQLQQQIDAQWATYQDLVRRSSNMRMHIPHLDGIYKRMGNVKDMMARQRMKLNCVKEKLKEKGLLHRNMHSADTVASNVNSEIIGDSLADSMLSLSLAHVVNANRSKLTNEKLSAIRDFTRNQQRITIIKPQRPNRVGLRSEVILETKLQSEGKAKVAAAKAGKTKQNKQTKSPAVPSLESFLSSATVQPVKPQAKPAQSLVESTISQPQLPKPTATKPPSAAAQMQVSFAPPLQTQSLTPSFNFGNSSPFVKTPTAATAATTATTSVAKTEELTIGKPLTQQTSSTQFIMPVNFGSGTPFSFGTAKSTASPLTATTLSKSDVTKDKSSAPLLQAPISFSPKVIGGGDADVAKSPPSLNFGSTPPAISASLKSGFATLSTGSLFSLAKPLATETTVTEETPKTFSFKPSADSPASPVSTPPTFGGMFAGTGKSTSTPLDSKSLATISTTSSNSFSFAGFGTSTQTTVAPLTTPLGTVAQTKSITSTTSSFGQASPITTTTSGSDISKPFFAGFGQSVGETATTTASTTLATTSVVNSPAQTTASSSLSFNALNLSVSSTSSVGTSTPQPLQMTSTAPSLPSSTTDATANLFGSLNVCNPTVKESDPTKPANIFSGFGSSAASFSFTNAAAGADSTTQPATASPVSAGTLTFGVTSTVAPTATSTVATAPPTTTATPNLLASSTAAPATLSTGFFGGLTASTTSTTSAGMSTTGSNLFSSPVSSSGGSLFGVPTTTVSSSGLFGSIPKPDQSVFSNSSPSTQVSSSGGTGLFAAAAASNPSPFGNASPVSSTASTGGSIFGGGSSSGGGSIFGGGATSTSPFGGGAVTSTANANQTASIFGGAAAQSSPSASSGSIFGQNPFGQPAAQNSGSIFGSSNTTQQQSSPFGSSGSIFGGGNATLAQPAFGSTATGTTGFGSFSQQSPGTAFGSPTGSVGGFAQGGSSVAQSGFGSPQQQSSAFAKPLFGGAPTFGSPPAFGAAPSFGGGATFGTSPKGFGTFAAPATASPGFGGMTQQKNNLFETLGATDTGLSFGNLAQNTNAQAQKPTFGGSSFMNYRS